MEGVGARLGRSSTRYGPPTVFTGPVRKWRKRWVPLAAPSGSSSSHHSAFSSPSNGSQSYSNGNTSGNGNPSSHLLLYKWTPLGANDTSNNYKETASPINPQGKDKDHDAKPLRRKFKYIPVCVLEKGNAVREAMSTDEGNADSASAEKVDINYRDENANSESEKLASAGQPDDTNGAVASPEKPNVDNGDSISVEKPDINNVPEQDAEVDCGLRQDLNVCVSEGDPKAPQVNSSTHTH